MPGKDRSVRPVYFGYSPIGAVVSLAVIDYGKLKLEQFRVAADSTQQLLEAYLRATESPQPDVWKRKLHVLEHFADDERMRKWAKTELRYIEDFAALDAFYRETLKVASQLVEPGRLNDPERVRARVRYNQLYWADLPFAGESQAVISAMIAFRNQLIATERAPTSEQAWEILNRRLIELSNAVRESTPNFPLKPTPQSGTAERKRSAAFHRIRRNMNSHRRLQAKNEPRIYPYLERRGSICLDQEYSTWPLESFLSTYF